MPENHPSKLVVFQALHATLRYNKTFIKQFTIPKNMVPHSPKKKPRHEEKAPTRKKRSPKGEKSSKKSPI